MKKTIGLQQLRVGMFVDRIEGAVAGSGARRAGFRLHSVSQLELLRQSNATRAVIDVAKGVDVAAEAPNPAAARAQLEPQFLDRFSAQEIQLARDAIARTVPHIRQIIETAHGQGTVDLGTAGAAVGEIMSGENLPALVALLKIKEVDESTFLHSLSVSALMILFARILAIDEETVKLYGMGGLLHDIGKVAIPPEVLAKSGRLSSEEYALIRSHPERGHAMLQKIEGVPVLALDICRFHHEKWDGSGYPLGLKGEAIPLSARIAAICDVYDALTTVRPYKRAWSQAEAVERMLASPGHFDPALLKKFVSQLVLSGMVV